MNTPNVKASRQAYFKTFFQNHLTIKARIGFLTFHKVKYSTWFEKILLICEYLQLISQIILFLPEFYEASYHRLYFRIIIYGCKLVNPSYLLSFENEDSTSESILALILSFTVLKHLIFFYIIAVAYWEMKGSRTIIAVWRLLFKTQGRLLCYFITSFWVRAIISIRGDGFQLYGLSSTGARAFLSFLVAIEYIFSFLIEMQFCDVLPRKSFLSAKNFYLQLTTLGQKLLIHLLQLSLKGNLKSRIWISSLAALAFCIIRLQRFFFTLPLYNFRALFVQIKLDSIVCGFSISYFFQAILMSATYTDLNIEFVIVAGSILSLLLMEGSQSLLRELIMMLFSSRVFKKMPDILMHKPILVKQLLQNEKTPSERSSKSHWTFLAMKIVNAHQTSIFDFDDDFTNNRDINEITIIYLEKLTTKFPKHRVTQLYLSKVGVKNLRMSSKALKIIGAWLKKPWSAEYLSAFFILCKFREVLLEDYKEKKDVLNLDNYIQSQKLLAELKEKMGKQAEMQASICSQILKDKCDIGEIFNKAQAVSKMRKMIHKEIELLPAQLPETFVGYLLLCAEYYLVLEFSQYYCHKYWENYNIKYLRYRKHFLSSDLMEENIYQSKNAHLILTGQQSKENGNIKYCSKAIEKVLGGDCQGYVSSHFSSLFLPSMQTYYRNLFKQIFEKRRIHLLDHLHTLFLCHKKGYVIRGQIMIQVHPYINENIYLSMIIRKATVFHEYLILRDNGDIEGATQTISEQLGLNLTPSKFLVNIGQISEELAFANEAFNILNMSDSEIIKPFQVQNPEKVHSSLASDAVNTLGLLKSYQYIRSHQEASEIKKLFSTDGKEVELKPTNSSLVNARKEIYHCNIAIVPFEGGSMKVIKLSRASKKGKTMQELGATQSPKNVGDETYSPKATSIGHQEDFFLKLNQVTELENQDYAATTLVSDIKATEILATEKNLLSSPSPGLEARNKNRNFDLITTVRPTSNRHLLLEENEESGSQTDFNQSDDGNQKKEEENLADFLSITTTTLRSSQEKAVYKAYRNHISKKSYSKSFKFLCVAFYGVILFTLLSQVVLKLVYDQTMQNLVVQKDLLNYAQTRTYFGTKACFSIMAIYGLTVGIDIWKIPNSLPQSPAVVLSTVQAYWVGLKDANNNILRLVNEISDEDIKKELFLKDVRSIGSIYDESDESEIYQTSFEVADLAVGAIKRLLSLPVGDPKSKTIIEYIRKSIQTDFLSKNGQITTMFQGLVQSQRRTLSNFIVLCLVVTPLLLGGVALLLTGIVWKQYSEETAYLRAFTRLDPTVVRSLLKDMEVFKNAIANDISFEDRRLIQFFWDKSIYIENIKMRTRRSRDETQVIDYFKLRKRYFLYILQVVIFVGILIAILLWNFLAAQHETNVIYRRQSQLEISNSLSEISSASIQGLPELFQSNNTYDYFGTKPQDYVEKSIGYMKVLQNQMIDVFVDLDGTYDPEIQRLMFKGKPCSEYQSYYVTYCKLLVSQGYITNAFSMMSVVVDLLVTKLDQYKTMNKTSLEDLYRKCYQGAGFMAVAVSMAAHQAQLMNEIVNVNLMESISQASKRQDTLLAVFAICLTMISLLIWVRILIRIREVRNDFKRVLQVLPPKLVLSSFLLKRFLSKASGLIQSS